MEIIALDIGQQRTGIARASSEARLAEPLTTVKTAQLMAELRSLLTKTPAMAIVVGLPRGSRGEDNQQTAWVRQQVASLKQQVALPIYWQDEFLTSQLAEQRSSKSHDHGGSDAVAAAIILEDFLSSDKNQRSLV